MHALFAIGFGAVAFVASVLAVSTYRLFRGRS